jgi:hypothetical protein
MKIEGGYFSSEKHVYRNERGTIIPSTTQIFSILGLSDFSRIDPEILEWKRCYGGAVHSAVEFLVAGDLDWDTLDENIVAPVTGIAQRLEELDFKVEATEERRVANIFGMEYGCTLDLRGTIFHQGVRRNVVIDEKTGSKFEKYWDWQIAGYLLPQPKTPLGWMGLVLQVDPRGRITPHYLKNPEAAKREFQTLLAAAILKINSGYAKLGT